MTDPTKGDGTFVEVRDASFVPGKVDLAVGYRFGNSSNSAVLSMTPKQARIAVDLLTDWLHEQETQS